VTPNQKRVAAAGLITSAIAFTGILTSEGFSPVATIPVPEDVPTYGHGSTVRPDGKPVQLGDTITRTEARQLAASDVQKKFEAPIKKCAGEVLMAQGEFDALIDMAYNMGPAKVCNSSIIPKFRAGQYGEGCDAILTFDRLHGKHCRDPYNLAHINGCKGIMNRRTYEYRLCTGGTK
jgi:lysozyme